jgi:hypothetical protein
MIPAPDTALTESPETLNVSVDRTRRAQMGAAVDGRLRVICDRRRMGPGAIARPNLPKSWPQLLERHKRCIYWAFPISECPDRAERVANAQVNTWKIRGIKTVAGMTPTPQLASVQAASPLDHDSPAAWRLPRLNGTTAAGSRAGSASATKRRATKK